MGFCTQEGYSTNLQGFGKTRMRIDLQIYQHQSGHTDYEVTD